MRHCWFDFEDGYWSDDDTWVGGNTCMLEANHPGPHEPTPDSDIVVEFQQVALTVRKGAG